ncbi:tetratricopeptide repeat protein [Arsukibacterium indicum]|uniref:Tetratricopeptide repeat protein n=1 Tax=Arsukibacterium indicum TaxID=2848612 RepID=A0ABS6MHB8_9GAMM|nr:tetratricopeptide repeat protein [Arsukibacterium indicum]MBV2127622.1 tetratricopeptide repeat protein [Arsukibacterium indicum]
MKILTALNIIFCLLLVASCQHSSGEWALSQQQQLLLDDASFSGETYPVETATQIFQLPDATKTQLNRLSASHQDLAARSKAILHYILAYAGDSLTYQHGATKTVSETLATGRANCLSLSLLTYSIAREVGIDAVFQDVTIPEYWSSSTTQTWLNGHINLKLLQNGHLNQSSGKVLLSSNIIVDFDSSIARKRFPAKIISSKRAIAMFYNNKAAEALDQSNAAQAYRYYQAAIATDPDFADTWSNLAVLYRLHNYHRLAEQTYHHSLALDPNSNNTLSNLAVLYRRNGNIDAAAKLEQRVYNKRKTNPWYFIMLGNEAIKTNNQREAIAFFQQALALDNNTHEAWFGLASSYFALNNNIKASQYLERAQRAATLLPDKERYQHKLSALNQLSSLCQHC